MYHLIGTQMDKQDIPSLAPQKYSLVSFQLLPHPKCNHSPGFNGRRNVSIVLYVTGIMLHIFFFFFWSGLFALNITPVIFINIFICTYKLFVVIAY